MAKLTLTLNPKPNHNPYPNPNPPDPPIPIQVHNLTANFHLNRPENELIQTKYLQAADQVAPRQPWIFRTYPNSSRDIDPNTWSPFDIRYRGVFQTLAKVPDFRKGLYENDTLDPLPETEIDERARYQGQTVYALLSEILDVLELKRTVEEGVFFLRPRLLNLQLEYLTRYRERYADGPVTAGFLAMDFSTEGCSQVILPVSATTTKQPLTTSLEGKFKLLLSQLALHVLHLRPPGDRIPDQEVFLIGLHGCRMHVMRAFFPGKKTSSLWSGRSAGFADSRTDSAPAPAPGPRETNARFYRKENIERVVQQAQTQTQTQRQQTDGEGEDEGEGVGDESTFRVLGTRECNLWDARDFHSAVRIVIGLSMYLMSGEAECGFLQKAFEHFPCLHGTGTETEPRIGTGTGTGIERLRQRAAREQMEAVLRERRKERHERKERARRRQRVFERSSAGDRRFGGFRDIRHRGWDWVWMDQQVDPSSEDEEDVILNSVCMSGRPD